jgi:hypothetical protein
VPVLAIFAWAYDSKSIYLSAKALTIAAPLVLLTIAVGVLWPRAPRERRALRIPVFVLAGVAAFAAAVSSFWALRDGRVGPEAHAAELSALKPKMTDGPVLYLGKSDLAQWDLVGLAAFKGTAFYAPLWVPVRPSKPGGWWGFTDFDSFFRSELDGMRYVLTTRTPFQSRPPRNWREIAHTRSFILWRRLHERTPTRIGADFADRPGRILDCRNTYGRRLLRRAGAGFAVVLPRPIVGRQTFWHGMPDQAGHSGTMTLRVPRGRWDLSLEYGSNLDLHVRAGNLDKVMPATTDRVGPYYYVGTVTQARSGPLTVKVTAARMNTLARLLGAPGRTRALDSPWNLPLNGVALTRHHERAAFVKPRAACGRWVDYVQPRKSAGTP